MSQTLIAAQVGKLEQDVAGEEDHTKVGQHLSVAHFPVLVHGDFTM